MTTVPPSEWPDAEEPEYVEPRVTCLTPEGADCPLCEQFTFGTRDHLTGEVVVHCRGCKGLVYMARCSEYDHVLFSNRFLSKTERRCVWECSEE